MPHSPLPTPHSRLSTPRCCNPLIAVESPAAEPSDCRITLSPQPSVKDDGMGMEACATARSFQLLRGNFVMAGK